MMYQKMWKAVMTAACALTLAIALSAGAQMQTSGKDMDTSGISGLSVEQGVLGKSVKTRSGENAGMIDDVIFSRWGRIAHYIVDVTPSQGMGEKIVALSPDQIQFTSQDQAVFNGTRADLERLPQVDPYAFGLYHGYYGPSGPSGYGPSYGGGPYNRPYYGPYGGAGTMGGPYDQGQERQYQERPYDQSQERQYQERPYDQSQERQYQERQGQYQQGPWQGQQPYQQPYSRREYYGPGPGNMGPGMQQGQMTVPRMRGQMMVYRGISSDEFLSAQVYNPQHDLIGEVEDLVVDPATHRVTHAVIGVEDREVVVPFNRLRYAGGDTVIYRGTESQLDQMPEYRVGQGGRVMAASASQAQQQKAGSSGQQPQQQKAGSGAPQAQTQSGQTQTQQTHPQQKQESSQQ